MWRMIMSPIWQSPTARRLRRNILGMLVAAGALLVAAAVPIDVGADRRGALRYVVPIPF
jgi:hypothetical protein